MVLVELNMFGIELMPIKIMTVADAAIASQVCGVRIFFSSPADVFSKILPSHIFLSLPLPKSLRVDILDQGFQGLGATRGSSGAAADLGQ
jgi:hypothetical protein